MVKSSSSFVKNSSHLQQEIGQTLIPSGYSLVSYDVTSLFTNIPVDLALTIIEKKWDTIEPYTSLPKYEFLAGLNLCITTPGSFITIKPITRYTEFLWEEQPLSPLRIL